MMSSLAASYARSLRLPAPLGSRAKGWPFLSMAQRRRLLPWLGMFWVILAAFPGLVRAEPALPPLSWQDPLLPYPSDLHTVSDPSAVTGRRLLIPDAVWTPELLAKAPFDPAPVIARMRTMDGFSAVMPFMASIPADIDLDALQKSLEAAAAPKDGTTATALPPFPVLLVDLDTRDRLPVRLNIVQASWDGKLWSLLLIHPRDRLLETHRYLVALQGLKDRNGQVIAPPPGFVETMRTPPAAESATWAPYAASLSEALRAESVPLETLTLAFRFTVASADTYTAELRSFDAQVDARAAATPYKATELKITHRPFKGTDEARLLGRGRFTVLRFTSKEGKRLPSATTEEVPFLMHLPDHCPEAGCGVVIFGHGLGATKETMFSVSDFLAQRGMATIAVPAPWHSTLLSSFKVYLGTHSNVDIFKGVVLEHIFRGGQVAWLIQQDLAGRDLRPARDIRKGGTPLKLRGDRIFYIGQSMGGIAGVGAVAMSPQIKAAVFDVTGGSLVDLTFDSAVAKMLRLPFFDFDKISAQEMRLISPLGMYIFDDLDPLAFGPYLTRTPFAGQSPRPISMQAGVGDGLVPNWTSEKLARAMGLPFIRTLADATNQSTNVEGPGIRFFKYTKQFFFAHMELMHAPSGLEAARFLEYASRLQDAAPAEKGDR